MTRTRTGVWFVGGRGNVATTAITGAVGIAHGTTDRTGMVTARSPCTALDLPSADGFVFGGHDIADRSLLDTATELGGLRELADRENVPRVGRDAKTGETLLKTAWGHVHFRGFTGTKMTPQFTWQGADDAGSTGTDVTAASDTVAGGLR